MSSPPRYKNLLRAVYSGIISSPLNHSELRLLAEELRRGRLPDELAYMLEQTSRHFASDSQERSRGDDREMIIERTLKNRKISRDSLLNIMKSIGYTNNPGNSSIRTLIRDFVSETSPAKIQQLLEILESASTGDEYLAGISATRK